MDTIKKSQKIFLMIVGTVWFLVSINCFFIWGGLGRYFRIIGTGGMLLFSILIIKKWRFTTTNLPLISCLLLFLFWLLQFTSGGLFLARIFDFLPLLLLFLWPKEILNDWYGFLRKVIIFFAIGASIVTILSFMGVLQYLPYYTVDPTSQLHKDRGLQYHIYGLFLTIPNETWASRACGPLQEPGHFAVLLGFFHLIDRFNHRKINFWIVLCGFLTFSSNFVLMFLFVEFHNFLMREKMVKAWKALFVGVIVVGLLSFILPQSTKDQITYLFFERNLESVYENYEDSGLTGALDQRAGEYSLNRYNNLSRTAFIFGTGYYDSSSALSDYRGTILYIGLIGLLLSILTSFFILMTKGSWRVKVSLFLCLFLVYLHRAWMLYSAFLYFLSYMAIALSSLPSTEISTIEEDTLPNEDTQSLDNMNVQLI